MTVEVSQSICPGRLSRRPDRRLDPYGLRACVVCGEIAITELAGDGLCNSHFWYGFGNWRGYGTIARELAHKGIDPKTGRKRFKTIPGDFKIGIMKFDAPDTTWTLTHALLKCDQCGDVRGGHRRGWLCDSCIERGRRISEET